METSVAAPVRHKLSVAIVQQMGELGIFRADDRIELIDGDLIEMAPIGPDHEATVIEFTEALVIACARRAFVSVQNSVKLSEWSAPQPDFAVLRRRADTYRSGERAGPADVLLLIEVADTSLEYDRTVKMRLYAEAGIAEFWLVDLKRRVVEAYRRPAGAVYRDMTIHVPGETLSLMLEPEIVVSLGRVFG